MGNPVYSLFLLITPVSVDYLNWRKLLF